MKYAEGVMLITVILVFVVIVHVSLSRCLPG